MTTVSSSFPFDDAHGQDHHRASFSSADPAARYPSPPMSPPQALPPPPQLTEAQRLAQTDYRPGRHPSAIYDDTPPEPTHEEVPARIAAERDAAFARVQQAARPLSYQPPPSSASGPSSATATPALSPAEQLSQFDLAREEAWRGAQTATAAGATSQSRKRASHQPPSATERAAPRVRTIGEDHPAVVAFKKEHPRRAQLEFGSYILLQTLGEGEFGKVKLGVHKDFGEECAVKLIKKNSLGGDGDSRMLKVRREIEVLSHVKHPNVVRLYDLVETEKYIGIILGFADGGELFDHILAHRYLKEKDASKLFAQLISGVHYLHSKSIIHRDLKLENLLLDKARNVIITDFGFANQFDAARDDLMATSCGSPCYAAPELVVAEGLYAGSAVDIWSCGVILYAMLSGYLPFDDDPANPEGDNINLLYRYILNTQLQFPSQISPAARDLLSIMLVPDPAKRATLADIMRHPWLMRHAELLDRSVDELEDVANRQHRIKRQQARREMEERKALKEKAAQKQAAQEMARSHSERNGLMATAVSAVSSRVKAQRHQSAFPASSTTMPDFFADGSVREGAATSSTVPSTPVELAPVSAPPGMRSRLDVDTPSDSATGGQRTSWTASDGQDSDFFLAEGDARGEPRSRVGSLASGSQMPAVDVTSSPTTSSRRKHHTIQVEYASEPTPASDDAALSQPMAVAGSSRSRTSSARSRTTSQLSTAAPLSVSDPVLSAPAVTAFHSVGAASLPPTSEAAAHDVEMASSLPPKLLDSGASSVAETALPTPAPSQLLARPSTPPKSKGPAPADLLTTPKATLAQAISPPDTPRGPALADITNGNKPTPAAVPVAEVAPVAAAAKPAFTPEAVTAAPLEPTRSRSTRSRMSMLLVSNKGNAGRASPVDGSNASVENAPLNADRTKAEKKGRRNTLTLALKSTLDRRSSKKSTPTSSVFTEPTSSSRQAKTSSRPASRMSTQPQALSPATPVDGQMRAQQDLYRPIVGRDAPASASTGPAKKVMDWFRRKSLKPAAPVAAPSPLPAGKDDSFVSVDAPTWTPPKVHRLSTDLSHAVVPASVAPPAVSTDSPLAPSLVVTGTAATVGPPSSAFSTHSTAPSSYRAVDSISSQRTAASARQQADSLAMPPPRVPAARTFNPASLRYHNGVIDQKTVTSSLPPAVLDQVVRVLQAMDVDIKRDGEFRLKCTRSKRARGNVGLGIAGAAASSGIVPSGSTMSGFSFMGMASSSQTDKRGLPMPSSPSTSFLSSSGLKGLMMRRSSSYNSSTHLSPVVPHSPATTASIDDSASSTGHLSGEDAAATPTTTSAAPSSSGVHAAPQQDSGDEVRFSVEVTRLKNLPGLYSVDFKRIKGSVWNYKSIYQKAVDSCAFDDTAK